MSKSTRIACLVGAAVLAVVTSACSGDDDGGTAASTTVSTLDPASMVTPGRGADCADPTGDIGAVAGTTVEQGTMSEPAGIDIVSAAATSVDATETLDVTFTMAGALDEVPDAQLVVSQGEPLQPISYELRVVREALGPWQVLFISWPDEVETRTPLAVTPTVEGTTLNFSVPRDQLPPIADQLAFGASAEVAGGDSASDVVFDDCSSLLSPSSSSDG